MQKIQLGKANKFLSKLPRDEFERLISKTEVVALTRGQVLSDAGFVPRYVYFPTSCLMSVHKPVDGQRKFALCTVGCEELVNSTYAIDLRSAFLRTVVLCPGQSLRMKLKIFSDEVHSGATLNRRVMEYALSLGEQFALTAGCNSFHTAEQRLARWLLKLRGDVGANNFYITHAALADLVGIRRVGITNAASAFKVLGLIDYSRGYVDIPEGHLKLLRLWPGKLLQARQLDYGVSGLMARRAAASFSR